jgi:hypothetical protein
MNSDGSPSAARFRISATSCVMAVIVALIARRRQGTIVNEALLDRMVLESGTTSMPVIWGIPTTV